MRGKIRHRLDDPASSGVYRAPRADDVVQAARGSELLVVRVPVLRGRDKPALLASIAQALAFPEWFGGNWDALEDCLTDLSWRPEQGHLLLFEGAQHLARDDFGVLLDVLTASAEFWTERGRPFIAVMVGGPDSLPPLVRPRKR